MIRAFVLSLRQLGDPRVLRLLVKSILVTLALLVAIGAAAWWALDAGLRSVDLLGGLFAGSSELREALAVVAVLIGGWLLWRVVALAVLQFFADDVVEAVEARHYPAAAASARPLGMRAEVRLALRGAGRALGWNLVALPFALALIVTGVGTALLFWAVNAVLIGRELSDLARLRHRATISAMPLSGATRFALGGVIAGLLAVPFVNLLAPFLGAAMATHLVHRKGVPIHAA
jgi:CysZ protein